MNNYSGTIIDYFKKSDIFLWILSLCAIIYSILLIVSMQRSGEYNYLRTQIIAIFLGLILAFVISVGDYKFLIRKWYFVALVGFALAMLVFVFGIQVTGTDDTAWVQLPGGITFQPSEFIKICFIITFTKHLSYLNEKNILKTFFGFCTLCIHALIPIILIHMQGDDGTVLIFGIIFLIMIFTAGIQARYFSIIFGGLFLSIPIIWNFFLNDEHRNRILALFDLDGNSMTNYGWQQYQGKVSIASGQVTGSGLFNGSRVEYGIVPEQENDFIFTVAGEELGFIGCVILLLILLLIIIRVYCIAKESNDIEGKFISCGVFAILSSQTIINIGMVLGFFPVIGITLPLFSSGGTSALSTLICLGLVQSVKYHNMDDMDSVSLRRGSQNRTRI